MFNALIGILIIGWAIVFVIHQVIGGFVNILTRGLLKKNVIAVSLKDLP